MYILPEGVRRTLSNVVGTRSGKGQGKRRCLTGDGRGQVAGQLSVESVGRSPGRWEVVVTERSETETTTTDIFVEL